MIFYTFTCKYSSQVIASSVTPCIETMLSWTRCMGPLSTKCSMVCTSPHSHNGDSTKFRLCIRAAQHPCLNRKLFKRSHVFLGKFTPFTSVVGSSISSLLWIDTPCHHSFHRVLKLLKLLLSLKKTQNGVRDLSLRFVGADMMSL